MKISWVRSLYGRLGFAMLLFALMSALLVGSSYVALEGARVDLTRTSQLGKERVFYEMLYLASRLPARGEEEWEGASTALRYAIDRNEQMLNRLSAQTDVFGLTAPPDGELMDRIEDTREFWEGDVRPALERAMAAAPLDRSQLDALDRLIRDYAARVDRKIEFMEQAATARLERSRVLLLAFSAAAVMTLFLALLIVRSIARRTRGLAATAGEIAAGVLQRHHQSLVGQFGHDVGRQGDVDGAGNVVRHHRYVHGGVHVPEVVDDLRRARSHVERSGDHHRVGA